MMKMHALACILTSLAALNPAPPRRRLFHPSSLIPPPLFLPC